MFGSRKPLRSPEREKEKTPSIKRSVVGLGMVGMALGGVGCSEGEEYAVDCYPYDEGAPSVYTSEDGNTYTGQAAIDAWEEENPPMPSEYCDDDFKAELRIDPKGIFKPMETTNPRELVEMFTHNINCLSESPHPELQQLCIRALTGDEQNELGQHFANTADFWIRQKTRNPDVELPDFRAEILESSVEIYDSIHEEDTVSFTIRQVQNSASGDEQLTTELRFARADVAFTPNDVDAFSRMNRSVLGEYHNIWVLSGYFAVD